LRSSSRRNFTLQFSLSSAFVGIVALTALLVGGSTFLNTSSSLREGISTRLHDVAGLAALQVDARTHRLIRSRDDERSEAYADLKRLLQRIRDDSTDVRFVYTVRKDGRGRIVFVVDAEEDGAEASHVGDVYKDASRALHAAFEPPFRVQTEKQFTRDQWGVWLSSYAPVLADDGSLEAVLGVDISAQRIGEYESRHALAVLASSLAICAGVVLLGVLFSRGISRPLLQLEGRMSEIQRLNLGEQVRVQSRVTEVIRMQHAVENMRSGLKSFRKYVPADLVAELVGLQREAVLGAEKKELTIFFSDIADFTAISELLPAERLVEELSAYFDVVTRAILENSGTVDKYIGDAVMAFWGAPRDVPDHAVMACRAALECRRRVQAISRQWLGRGLPSLRMRIGIHTGEAVVGNMGYEERLNYTVMGDSVNLASRLEGLGKYYGTDIIVSEATRNLASGVMAARQLDVVAVKGKTRGVAIFELVGERDRLERTARELVALFDEGMSLYLERRWEAAGAVFAEASRRRPTDRPARILLDRCMEYGANPPPADWRGVVVMREK
jgi:class 3 adenylate cyclase